MDVLVYNVYWSNRHLLILELTSLTATSFQTKTLEILCHVTYVPS